MDFMYFEDVKFAKKIMQMLVSNLDKEKRFWKPFQIKPSYEQEINPEQRDAAALRLTQLSAEFKFLPETCGLAILLMDRVFQVVKVRAKYLKCVYVTCLYLAAKTLEEDENIPPTPEFVRRSQCGCSFSEISRMEIVILSKLDWNIRMPSAVDFIHTIFAVLLTQGGPMSLALSELDPGKRLSLVMRKMIKCLSYHQLMQYRPSAMALSLISLELEQITPSWLRLIFPLLQMTNVGSEQLMQCRSVMARILGHQPLAGLPTESSRKTSSFPPQSKKRKVDHALEDENIYEGIKRLYGEDEKYFQWSSCALQVHQDTDETRTSTVVF